MVVYKHICPDGMVYIGITNNIEDRWENNGIKYHDNKVFTDAIKKFGWENIKHEIIAFNVSEEDAHLLEQQLIQENMNHSLNLLTYDRNRSCEKATLYLNSDLYREFRYKAQKNHKKPNRVLEELLKQYINENK